MSQDQQTYRRATTTALVGLAAQVLLVVAVGLAGLYAQSPALHVATWHMLGGVPIWIVLWVLFNHHRQERAEALEAETLAKTDAQAAALFEEAGDQLALARQRLGRLYKYGLNLTALGIGLYLLIVGGVIFWLNYAAVSQGTLAANAVASEINLGLLGLILGGGALISFLVARYVAGMTDERSWAPLRAGASYLMGNALVLAALALCTGLAYFGWSSGFVWLALAIPLVMAVLGLEVLLSLLLAVYRPARPNEAVRPAFDSRLLGVMTRPESIGKIVSETINYQFGFDVSGSWFYRLTAKAFIPLVLLCTLLVIAISSLVIVAPYQQAVITTFGRFDRVVGPGLTLKWPWPISGTQKVDVGRVHQIVVGSRGEENGKQYETHLEKPVLWAVKHAGGQAQAQYLVTAPTPFNTDTRTKRRPKVAAGELLGADVAVQYRVDADRLRNYVSVAENPRKLLDAIIEQQVTEYFASRTVPQMLSADRVKAGQTLRKRIAQSVRKNRLGIAIEAVSVSSVHPPHEKEVAAAFHKQIGAAQEKQTKIEKGRKDATSTLAEVAGSREQALKISQAIEQLNHMRSKLGVDQPTTGIDLKSLKPGKRAKVKQVAQKALEIEKLMDDAGGEAAQRILKARAYRWTRALGERAKADRFDAKLAAYREAPSFFKARLRLETLSNALDERRKIILDSRKKNSPLIRVQLEPPQAAIKSFNAQEGQ